VLAGIVLGIPPVVRWLIEGTADDQKVALDTLATVAIAGLLLAVLFTYRHYLKLLDGGAAPAGSRERRRYDGGGEKKDPLPLWEGLGEGGCRPRRPGNPHAPAPVAPS